MNSDLPTSLSSLPHKVIILITAMSVSGLEAGTAQQNELIWKVSINVRRRLLPVVPSGLLVYNLSLENILIL